MEQKIKRVTEKIKTSYKLSEDYDIFDNNCCTMSTDGLSLIEENWLGEEHDSRNSLSFLEKNYKKLGLSRTVYKKGGITITTYVPPPPKKKEEKKKEKKS
ncbi:hypothetical protein CLV94_1245 [Flavobacterium endophyticum]|uniref:Uncharacterized protein n=1 Tax=Flavobacterium endophyticum TaxID=1540163 RepID=A0A495ML88_9FLAO|nr:hypothetical protein [Flavobacterium endophyticum]RKS26188.1 hypothetical protein CLV94_1245 [Flavobacterium endophyticum]